MAVQLDYGVAALPNISPVRYDRAMTMKVDHEFTEALDRVRSREKPALTRSDCIRRLVFEADRKARKK